MLRTHSRAVHVKVHAVVCGICGIELSCKDALKRHQIQHQGNLRAPVNCNICGLKVIDKNYLKRHTALQQPVGGKKEFKCHSCSRVSTSLKALKRHIVYIHKTSHDFKCTICGKAFKRSVSLKVCRPKEKLQKRKIIVRLYI